MLKKSWKMVAAVFALLAIAYVAHKKMPPYYLGLHSAPVEAHSSGEAGASGPHIGNCPMFPEDNIWNTPIDTLPKLPKSDAYIASIGAKKVHPDFGSNLTYGIPYTGSQKTPNPSRFHSSTPTTATRSNIPFRRMPPSRAARIVVATATSSSSTAVTASCTRSTTPPLSAMETGPPVPASA